MMGSWNIFSQVRKIHVLGNQESFFRLRSIPDFGVGLSSESLIARRVYTMAESRLDRSIFIQLDVHLKRGASGTGRSSAAAVAAKAIAACTSSGCNEG